MPNWVESTLQGITGDPKEVFGLLRSDKSPVDFNNVVPMPEDIRALVDAQPPTMVTPDGTKGYDWPIRDAWNKDHWGTKWNAHDAIQIQKNAVSFLTAWNAPWLVFEALAQRFPGHEIVVYSDEEVGLFHTTFTLKGGEVTERARAGRHRRVAAA